MSKNNGRHQRVFLALRTHQNHSDFLDAVRAQMPDDRTWKKTLPHDDHVSLAFLGNLKDNDLKEAAHLLREFAQSVDPFELRFTGIYSFLKVPGNGRPHPEDAWEVLSAFPDPAGYARLQDIHRRAAYDVLMPNGFEFGRPMNMPHNTLARVNKLEEQGSIISEFTRAHGELIMPPETYTHLTLFAHDRETNRTFIPGTPTPPKYNVVESFPLRGVVQSHYRRPKYGKQSGTPTADSI